MQTTAASAELRRLFVFIHIQKTAGTSMRGALQGLFEGRVFWHGRDGDIDDLFGAPDADALARYDVIGGHFGLSELPRGGLDRQVVVVSVVRDPVDQILSHFQFIGTRPDNSLHTGLPFAEVVSTRSAFAEFSRGLQCRMLSGRPNAKAAIARIARMDHIIATIDRVDDLVQRVAVAAGLDANGIEVGRVNVGAEGYRGAYRDEAALAAVRQLAHEDAALFRTIEAIGGLSERISPPVYRIV